MSKEFDFDDDFLTGAETDIVLSKSGDEKLALAAVEDAQHWEMAIQAITTALEKDALPKPVIEKLLELIPSEYFHKDDINADFDMDAFLQQDMQLVRALRDKVLVGGGSKLRHNVSISEAKSVMDTCRQFGNEIRKNIESLNDIRRVQALESAVLETINGKDEKFRKEFLVNFEESLKRYCKAKG